MFLKFEFTSQKVRNPKDDISKYFVCCKMFFNNKKKLGCHLKAFGDPNT